MSESGAKDKVYPIGETRPVRGETFNLRVNQEENVRLQWLSTRVLPSTKSEVCRTSIQIFEILIKELDQGSRFFIQRTDDENPVEYYPLKKGG